MKKSEELSNPKSCFNKADDGEMMFVLLERDMASVATVIFWIRQRILLNLNGPGDEKIKNAQRWVQTVIDNIGKQPQRYGLTAGEISKFCNGIVSAVYTLRDTIEAKKS